MYFAFSFTHQVLAQLVEEDHVPIHTIENWSFRMGQPACKGNFGASTALTTPLETQSNRASKANVASSEAIRVLMDTPWYCSNTLASEAV